MKTTFDAREETLDEKQQKVQMAKRYEVGTQLEPI